MCYFISPQSGKGVRVSQRGNAERGQGQWEENKAEQRRRKEAAIKDKRRISS